MQYLKSCVLCSLTGLNLTQHARPAGLTLSLASAISLPNCHRPSCIGDARRHCKHTVVRCLRLVLGKDVYTVMVPVLVVPVRPYVLHGLGEPVFELLEAQLAVAIVVQM